MREGRSGMIARKGFAGDVMVPIEKKPARRTHGSRERAISLAAIALVPIALLAFVLAPVDTGSGSPARESDCTGCHDQIVETLLTVTGLPSEYTPGAVYTITIQVDDLNGPNGENGFYMISDGGVFSNPGANAEVNTDTTASTIDTRPRPESSWTVDWTAPMSGTVIIHVYAVSATDSLTGQSAPSDEDVVTIASSAIPEFSVLLLPITGIAVIILGVMRLTRKGRQ